MHDAYVRFTLTVIAVLLGWSCLKELAEPAAAQTEAAQKVVIVGWESSGRALPVVLVNEKGAALVEDEGIRALVTTRAERPMLVEVMTAPGRRLPVEIAPSAGSVVPVHVANTPELPVPVEVLRAPASLRPGQ